MKTRNTIYILSAICACYCAMYLISQGHAMSGVLLVVPMGMLISGIEFKQFKNK